MRDSPYRADPNDPDHGTWLALGWTWAGFPEHAGVALLVYQAHASKGDLADAVGALDSLVGAPGSSPMATLGHILEFAALGRADAVDGFDGSRRSWSA